MHFTCQINVPQFAAPETPTHETLFTQKNEDHKLTESTALLAM